MRAVVQRVAEARVLIEGRVQAAIGPGLLVLVGVGRQDTRTDADWLARKVADLRIFDDDQGRMNRSVVEVGGAILVVSQFTLYGDCRRGRRPSFSEAMAPELAAPLVDAVVQGLAARGLHVAQGHFGARMDVALVNRGPVTVLLDSRAPA